MGVKHLVYAPHRSEFESRPATFSFVFSFLRIGCLHPTLPKTAAYAVGTARAARCEKKKRFREFVRVLTLNITRRTVNNKKKEKTRACGNKTTLIKDRASNAPPPFPFKSTESWKAVASIKSGKFYFRPSCYPLLLFFRFVVGRRLAVFREICGCTHTI